MLKRKSHVRTSRQTVRAKTKSRTVHRKNNSSELLAPCRSRAQLADRLTRIFEGKLISVISPQKLGEWYNGILPIGVPLPPQPVRNLYDTGKMVNWVTQFIIPLPDWGYNGNGNGSESAKKFREKEEEAKLAKFEMAIREEQIQAGKFKSVELFNRHMANFFTEINSYITWGESILSNTITESINVLTVDDSLKLNLLAAVRDGARKAADNFRAGLKQSLERHKETDTPESK